MEVTAVRKAPRPVNPERLFRASRMPRVGVWLIRGVARARTMREAVMVAVVVVIEQGKVVTKATMLMARVLLVAIPAGAAWMYYAE